MKTTTKPNTEYLEFDISDIKPSDNNARNNTKTIEYVKNSIQEFGYLSPIVLSEDGTILAGHSRYFALKELGYKKVHVIVEKYLDEKKRDKYRILDNLISEATSWHKEELATQMFYQDNWKGFEELTKKYISIDDLGMKPLELNLTKHSLETADNNINKTLQKAEGKRTLIACPYCYEDFEI